MHPFRTATIGATLLLLSSCATTTVDYVDAVKTYKHKQCSIDIYQTKEGASEIGPFKDVCVVTGSSVFSFNHSHEGAIKKVLPKLCSCGVKAAYIQSRHQDVDMGMKSLSHVTLVGIKLK